MNVTWHQKGWVKNSVSFSLNNFFSSSHQSYFHFIFQDITNSLYKKIIFAQEKKHKSHKFFLCNFLFSVLFSHYARTWKKSWTKKIAGNGKSEIVAQGKKEVGNLFYFCKNVESSISETMANIRLKTPWNWTLVYSNTRAEMIERKRWEKNSASRGWFVARVVWTATDACSDKKKLKPFVEIEKGKRQFRVENSTRFQSLSNGEWEIYRSFVCYTSIAYRCWCVLNKVRRSQIPISKHPENFNLIIPTTRGKWKNNESKLSFLSSSFTLIH